MFTSLRDLVDSKEYIRLASRDDNDAILECLKQIPMEAGSMEIKYERSPDYFRLIDQQSEKAFVFIFENEDRSIGGVATIGLRKCYICGKQEVIAYLGDLRITRRMSRKTRIEWKKQFGDLVENYKNLEEFDGCKYFYTAILSKNKRAINALAKRNKDCVYKEVAPYQSINILGRNPLNRVKRIFTKSSEFTIRKAKEDDIGSIRTFLKKENRLKPIGDYFSDEGSDELDRRIKNWENFSIQSFLIIEDNSGKIVATVAPWLSTEGRRLVVGKVNFSIKALGSLLPMLRGRRLKEQEELKILYMTHFEISSELNQSAREKIFKTALDYVFESKEYTDKHMISFADFPSRSFRPALKGEGYITNFTGGSIYQVLSHKDNEGSYFIPGIDKKYFSFELGIA